MNNQSSLERLIREEAQRRFWLWLIGILGPVGILFLLLIVFVISLVLVLSGGNQYGMQTYVGSAQALPASWLGLVDQSGMGLPNVVTLADMELESGGKANATNYNLTGGKSSDTEPIGQPGVKILSVDAGLMQINSGFPPYWPARPKWNHVFGPTGDPYDPAKNIAAGETELYWDTRQNGGYLEKGLSAYNTGSGTSKHGQTYANDVLQNINAYESGPEADAWATGNYTGQANNFLWWHWGSRQWVQPYSNAPTWILVAGSYAVPYPHGGQTVLWAPPPPIPGNKLPAQTLTLLPLYPPTKVTINGQIVGDQAKGGQTAALDPPDAPIIPGQTVFGLQLTKPGTYTAQVEWKWVTWVGKPPRPVYHYRTIQTSPITVLPPAKQ